MTSIVTIGALCAKRVTATWNPSDKAASVTLSNGNLTAACNSPSPVGAVRATVSRSTGKWYYEVHIDSFSGVAPGPNNPLPGIATSGYPLTGPLGGNATPSAYSWQGSDGFVTWNSGTFTSVGASFSAGDVVAIAVDLGAGKIWWAKNNVWISGDPASGTSPSYSGLSGTFSPAVSVGTANAPGGSQVTARFAAGTFTYTPPSGYSQW